MLKVIDCTRSVGCTVIEVTEVKGVPGVVVNFAESNDDSAQLQSESAPNPQKIK